MSLQGASAAYPDLHEMWPLVLSGVRVKGRFEAFWKEIIDGKSVSGSQIFGSIIKEVGVFICCLGGFLQVVFLPFSPSILFVIYPFICGSVPPHIIMLGY